jgi:hypothetical protein
MAPPIKPEEVASLTNVKVYGVVSSDQIAAMSRQLYFLTEWATFLDSIDWSKVPRLGGPATIPPPPPPKWP